MLDGLMASRRTIQPRVPPADSSPGRAWASLASGYQHICPSLTWQEVSPANKFIKALRAELNAPHTELCLAMCHLRYVQEFARRGLLRSLDDLLPLDQRKDFFQPLLELCSYEGKLYLIPEDFSPYVLVSRKDILAQHGFTPPKTWKELERQARKLSALRSHPVIGVSTSTPHQFLTFFLALMGSNGILPPHDAEEVLKDQKSYFRAYEWIRSMIGTDPILDMEAITRRSYGVSDCFNRDKWIYRFCWLQDIKKEPPIFFEQVNVQIFPKGPSCETPVVLGRGHGWLIPQRSLKHDDGIAGLQAVTKLKNALKQERLSGYPFHARREIWTDPAVKTRNPIYEEVQSLLPKNARYTTDYANEFLDWLARSFAAALARNDTAQKWLSKMPRSIRQDTHQLVNQATSYMRKNLGKQLSVEKISQALTASRRHLDRLFQQEMNLSVADFLKNLRMEKAKELLKNTSLSVKEVARETGFSDHSVFSRTFRRHWGSKPKDVRVQGSRARAAGH
jgi:AraC-like DNA-binding protein